MACGTRGAPYTRGAQDAPNTPVVVVVVELMLVELLMLMCTPLVPVAHSLRMQQYGLT